VFRNCRLTAAPGIDKCYLGRPWGAYAKTVFIGCELGSHIVADGWHDWEKEGKPNTKKNSYYAEYQNFGPGARGPRVKWAHTLTAKQAAEYSFEKVMYQAEDGIRWNPYDNR
jgi:pectinesterase